MKIVMKQQLKLGVIMYANLSISDDSHRTVCIRTSRVKWTITSADAKPKSIGPIWMSNDAVRSIVISSIEITISVRTFRINIATTIIVDCDDRFMNFQWLRPEIPWICDVVTMIQVSQWKHIYHDNQINDWHKCIPCEKFATTHVKRRKQSV